ncbi:LIM and SH3 domain protein 1-like isoform X2 [Ptychodera flava]|uniref:LIM and SH3 domain protein 1-like isoform X2 n=1 Tax=Ptychodera flava TaxID=63121 RepID=UPI00396A0E18
MNPPCGKCRKTVYPMEKLNCLDKYWHKACFKCEVCAMTLNMRNYKGYNKMPYCHAHYPTTKFTAVADTPENLRLKKQSAIISNVKYHQEFEESKGKMMSVADDPETLRIKKNTQIQSQAQYHGHQNMRDTMEARRPMGEEDGVRQPRQIEEYDPIKDLESVSRPPQKIGSIDNYNPLGDGDSYRSSTKFQLSSSGRPPSYKEPAVIQPHPQSQPSYNPPPQQQYRPQSFETPQPYRPPGAHQPTYPMPQVHAPRSPPAYQPAPQPQYEPEPPRPSRGLCFRAMYDYTAADDDEVTFLETDILINCEKIDDGWMQGTNERTGETGMLPSNYVEPV